VPELQQLRAEHEAELLKFERANRAYFAASISDRGDEFFDQFTEWHGERLAEQEIGTCSYFVLVDEEGSVLGRFNLVDIENGQAEVGYRVAQRVAGRGVATAALRDLCRLATSQLGVRTLKAKTTDDNVASQRVLIKGGFSPVGPTEIKGRAATWYQLELLTTNHRVAERDSNPHPLNRG
jgi:ribosomal-protein-alanine N-acetyltransferase